jgi:nitrogen fixation NifU-like protein
MNDIQSLYQQMILDHNKNPRNFGGLEEPTHCAEGHNPLCGDEVTIFMNIKDNVISRHYIQRLQAVPSQLLQLPS